MTLTKKIIVGLIIYLAFLIATLPANVAIKFVTLPQGVKITGMDGSIWHGRAESLTIDGRVLDALNWQLSPWRLLLGQAQLDFMLGQRNGEISAKGLVRASFSGFYVENLRLETPIPFLIGRNRLPLRTEIKGEMSLMLNEFGSGTPWCDSLSGKVIGNQVKVDNQFGSYPLGDMVFSLSCNQGNIELKTDEKMNRLGLSGTLVLEKNNLVDIKAKMKETADQPADLKKMLSQFGAKDSQGYYSLNYKGAIPRL